MKKSFLMLTMSFIFGTAAQAQTQNWEWTLKPQFYVDYVVAFDPETFVEIVSLPPLRAAENGFIEVRDPKSAKYGEQKTGLVNEKGELVVPLQFCNLSTSSREGLICAQEWDENKYWDEKKWGLIDKTGKWVVQPQSAGCEVCAKGLIGVSQNDKVGFVDDKTGKWVIQPQFDAIGGVFYTGLMRALLNGKYGLIDSAGNWVVQPQFNAIQSSELSSCPAQSTNEKWGTIDKLSGKWIIQPQFENVYFQGDWAYVLQNGKWGIIDKSGKTITQPQFQRLQYLSHNLVVAQKDDKWGTVDKFGKWIEKSNYSFDDLEIFGDSWPIKPNGAVRTVRAGTYPDGKNWKRYGLMDSLGTILLATQYEDVVELSEDLVAYCDNSAWKILHKKGKNVITESFQKVKNFSEGLAPAKKMNKWGFIDKTGKWIIQPQFEDAEIFTDGLAVVSNERGDGVIDKTGKWVIQPQFGFLHNYGKGLFGVIQDEKLGFIRLKSSK
jgi:WG containing repeat